MARTPLLALFRRAHRLQQQQAGGPVGPRLSRRTFVASSSATLLAAACPDTTEPPLPGNGKVVAVVGGGLAGLHCAHRLKGLGVGVTVYEAQQRLGGRVFSDRTTFAPLHAELGGELIDTGHETMFDLGEEFSLQFIDYKTDDAALDAVTAFFAGGRVAIADVLAAYTPIAARIDADLATISGDGFVTYDANNNGAGLDALSIKAWFDALVDDGVIAADNIARQLLEVAYSIEYGRETSEQSVLNMMFLVSTDTEDLALFGDSDELFKIAGGNDALISGLQTSLGNRIELGFKLTSISRDADGLFTLGFNQTTDAGDEAVEVTADEVVLALPFTMLRDVAIDTSVTLSPQKRLAIDTIGYGTNSKLMLGFSERFWRNGVGGNTSNGETFSDTGYQATWETSRLQDGASGIVTNFTGGNRGAAAGLGTPADRAAEFLTEFEGVFPGVTAVHNGKLARFHWPTNDFVRASYSCYAPGQYSTICGAEIEAEADGHLHFCGEHTSLDAQGYMEGAALTGAAAAVAVAANLGVQEQALLADSPASRILARADVVRRERRHRRRR